MSHDYQVTYEIEGFLEKNRDSLPDTVVDALRQTTLRLLAALFSSAQSSSPRRDQLRKSFLRKRWGCERGERGREEEEGEEGMRRRERRGGGGGRGGEEEEEGEEGEGEEGEGWESSTLDPRFRR